MTTDAPKPAAPLNPTWGMLGIAVASHLFMLGGWYKDTSGLRDFQTEQLRWNAAIEKRLQTSELDTGKALVALSKDVERMSQAIASIQQALMVRPSSNVYASPTP